MPRDKGARSARSSSARKVRDAASYLRDVEALQIKLENGEEVTFNLADELRIPSDPKALLAAARRAPAQVAFWGYQTERALAQVRIAESRLEVREAREFLVYRAYHLEEDCEMPPQATLRARVDSDQECKRLRVALRARRKEYGALRSVRAAVDHRAWTIRSLIGKDEPT